MKPESFLELQDFSLILRTESQTVRREHLNTLEKLIRNHQDEIIGALYSDLKKPATEVLLTEVFPLLSEIKDAKKNLKKWMRPTKVRTPLTLLGTKSSIRREPRGVCLIISPWNYPLQLCLAPLVSALAAGNCVVLKPSELSPYTSALINNLIPKYFNSNHVCVVEGDATATENLLKLPFDHVFFTGSTQVGKKIMEQASRHLSSLTLELGGKSPAIVDDTANLQLTAEKIIWGKFLNCGQTCIAPDYLLVHEQAYPELKKHLVKTIHRFFGSTTREQKESSSYGRILNDSHMQRLHRLFESSLTEENQIICGGEFDFESKFVTPTLMENISPQSDLLKEEIFGPLLPLIKYHDLKEAIHFINGKPKPLALYIFSESRLNEERIISETSSGSVCVNNALMQISHPELPFGGIGASGMGSYHGYFGFRTFSHEKSIMFQRSFRGLFRPLYPPYSERSLQLIKKLIRFNP